MSCEVTMSDSAITSIVLTLNEEINLDRCLSSLKWTDRIIVIDSGSSDKTVDIAKSHGCEVFSNPWGGFSSQRNWALDNTNIQTDWVLFLDADEELPPRLIDSICRETRYSHFSAYYLCPKIYFLGKWIRHSQNFPVWHLRLLRKGRVRFKDSVTGHGETWEVKGEIGTIRQPYIHYSFSHGLKRWFEKHNQLSSIECQFYFKNHNEPIQYRQLVSKDKHRRRQALRTVSYKIPLRPFLRFFFQLFLKGGFLDGPAGWVYCGLYMVYEIMISAKICEAKYLKRGRAH
jgi:glycosyltransferase involved in cell wall biosynthesis